MKQNQRGVISLGLILAVLVGFGIWTAAVGGAAYFKGRESGIESNEKKWTKWQQDYFAKLDKKVDEVKDDAKKRAEDLVKTDQRVAVTLAGLTTEIKKRGPVVIRDTVTGECKLSPTFEQDWNRINRAVNSGGASTQIPAPKSNPIQQVPKPSAVPPNKQIMGKTVTAAVEPETVIVLQRETPDGPIKSVVVEKGEVKQAVAPPAKAPPRVAKPKDAIEAAWQSVMAEVK